MLWQPNIKTYHPIVCHLLANETRGMGLEKKMTKFDTVGSKIVILPVIHILNNSLCLSSATVSEKSNRHLLQKSLKMLIPETRIHH